MRLKDKIALWLCARKLEQQFYEAHKDDWQCEICSALNDNKVSFCECCHNVKDVK